MNHLVFPYSITIVQESDVIQCGQCELNIYVEC